MALFNATGFIYVLQRSLFLLRILIGSLVEAEVPICCIRILNYFFKYMALLRLSIIHILQ